MLAVGLADGTVSLCISLSLSLSLSRSFTAALSMGSCVFKLEYSASQDGGVLAVGLADGKIAVFGLAQVAHESLHPTS